MIEQMIERLLFSARWLMAPIYLGLSLVLIALGVKFFQEAYHLFTVFLVNDEADLVLRALALVDMTLVGSLVVMIMFSGYENFVSKIDIAEESEKMGWLGKLDAATLKLKVAASIVAISSIHLLRKFMEVKKTDYEDLMWYTILHLTFVVSAVLMAYLDKIAFAAHRDHN